MLAYGIVYEFQLSVCIYIFYLLDFSTYTVEVLLERHLRSLFRH